jgi:dienelactone hydrolase
MASRGTSQAVPASGPGGRLRRGLAVLVAVILAVGVIAYGVVSYLVYDGLGTAPRACWPADRANTPDSFTVPAEFDPALATANLMPVPQDVAFHSRDPQMPDANLAAWWIPAVSPAAPAIVVVHGIKSCRREPNVLLAAGMLYRHGYSVLLMDLRDHGDSEGDDARFAGGSEEYLDVLGAWDWLVAQGVPEERIGILGMSFGAATSVIAGGQEPRVAAVWADSSPTEMRRAIGLFLEDQAGLPDLLVPGAILWARIIAGDDLTAFDPIDEVARYGGRSIAFVHGERDEVLPASMAQELHDRAVTAGAASPDAWAIAGAGHTQGVYVAPEGYETRLVEFFDAAIGDGG